MYRVDRKTISFRNVSEIVKDRLIRISFTMLLQKLCPSVKWKWLEWNRAFSVSGTAGKTHKFLEDPRPRTGLTAYSKFTKHKTQDTICKG